MFKAYFHLRPIVIRLALNIMKQAPKPVYWTTMHVIESIGACSGDIATCGHTVNGGCVCS